jgi:hypothetical protein
MTTRLTVNLTRPSLGLQDSLLKLLTFALAMAMALLARPAQACSVCGCGDPILSASDPAAIAGTLRLQFDVEYLRIDAGTDGVPGGTDQLKQLSYRLNAVYRPFDALTLGAALPVVSKSITSVGVGPAVVASDLTGLGDIEVTARYVPWRSVQVGARRAQELAVAVGTSLPTGAHDAKDAGNLIDPHGQLGTGAWGPFAGLHYRFEQGDWTSYAGISYRHRAEGSYFDGSKYKFGDALLWSVHGQYLVASRVALDLGVDGRDARPDRAVASDGTVTDPVENTGGTVWSLAPGVYVNAAGGFWLFARGQVPFIKKLDGEQDVLPSFTVGVQYLAW